MEYILSTKGNRMLKYESHSFTIYWKCHGFRKLLCRSRAVTDDGKIVSCSEHNHPANPSDVAKKNAVNDLKETVTTSNQSTNSILADKLPNLSGNVRILLPKKSSIKRTLRLRTMIQNFRRIYQTSLSLKNCKRH